MKPAAWAQELLGNRGSTKKQEPEVRDQITIISRPGRNAGMGAMAPMIPGSMTGAGVDGQTQPTKRVDAEVHEGEGILNNNAMQALGEDVFSALSEQATTGQLDLNALRQVLGLPEKQGYFLGGIVGKVGKAVGNAINPLGRVNDAIKFGGNVASKILGGPGGAVIDYTTDKVTNTLDKLNPISPLIDAGSSALKTVLPPAGDAVVDYYTGTKQKSENLTPALQSPFMPILPPTTTPAKVQDSSSDALADGANKMANMQGDMVEPGAETTVPGSSTYIPVSALGQPVIPLAPPPAAGTSTTQATDAGAVSAGTTMPGARMYDRIQRNAMAQTAQTAEGGSQADRTIANNALRRLDASAANQALALGQQIASNPNLTEGAANQALMQLNRDSAQARGESVADLTASAQQNAQAAAMNVYNQATQGKTYEEITKPTALAQIDAVKMNQKLQGDAQVWDKINALYASGVANNADEITRLYGQLGIQVNTNDLVNGENANKWAQVQETIAKGIAAGIDWGGIESSLSAAGLLGFANEYAGGAGATAAGTTAAAWPYQGDPAKPNPLEVNSATGQAPGAYDEDSFKWLMDNGYDVMGKPMALKQQYLKQKRASNAVNQWMNATKESDAYTKGTPEYRSQIDAMFDYVLSGSDMFEFGVDEKGNVTVTPKSVEEVGSNTAGDSTTTATTTDVGALKTKMLQVRALGSDANNTQLTIENGSDGVVRLKSIGTGKDIGYVNNGEILDADGKKIGYFKDGRVYDLDNVYMGYVGVPGETRITQRGPSETTTTPGGKTVVLPNNVIIPGMDTGDVGKVSGGVAGSGDGGSDYAGLGGLKNPEFGKNTSNSVIIKPVFGGDYKKI